MHFGEFTNSHRFGIAQEAKAARFLRSQGLRLLARNYRSRFGEIDLIMSDANTVVFVEVRFRQGNKFGGALSSVTPAKQKKIRLTAACYLQSHPRLANHSCRFDVIGLSQTSAKTASASEIDFDWIKSAFY